MVTTRSVTRKRLRDNDIDDELVEKRLRIGTMDSQPAGAAIAKANRAGVGAAAGESTGIAAEAAVDGPMGTNHAGAVDEVCGDGSGFSISTEVVDDDMRAARAALYNMHNESASEVASCWNGLFRKAVKSTEVEAAEGMVETAGAAAKATGPGAVPAETIAGTNAAVEVKEYATDGDGGGGSQMADPRVSKEGAEFINKQRPVWAHCGEQVRADRAAFLAAMDGPGVSAHLKLAKDMGAASATEEQYLVAREALSNRIQEWQQEQFVASCGGQAAIAKYTKGLEGSPGTDKEGAPSTAGAGKEVAKEGIGPSGGVFGAADGGDGSNNDSLSTGETDEELSDESPKKIRQPSPSYNGCAGKGKGKGKRRREEEDVGEEEEDEGHGVKRARQ